MSTGTRFVLPYQTVIDNAGVPLPGALLFFYASGTDIPLATYANVTLTTPNTNPVVADAAGEFPNIFLSNAQYKVVLMDSALVEIWTADPVVGIGAQSESQYYAFVTTTALLAAFGAGIALANGTQASTTGRTAEGDGGGAVFYYNAADTTTVDNAGTIRVDAQGRRWYAIVDGVFNVRLFGAVGDDTHDDSAAIIATVNAAAGASSQSQNFAEVYFPAGTYKVTQSAVLTQTNDVNGYGLHYRGDGSYTSTLRLHTSNVDLYFYDNVATNRMIRSTFADLHFQGMDPANFVTYANIPSHAKGFRLYADVASPGGDQDFKWTRCEMGYLDTAYVTAGTNVTSENSFVQCDIHQIKTAVAVINNIQSLNLEFHASNLTNIYGDCFQVSSGGAIKMFGGSVVMSTGTGTDQFFFNGVGGTGPNAYPFVFYGVRMELTEHCNIITTASTNQFSVVFNNCLFLDAGTIPKAHYCQVKAYTDVIFRDCTFVESVAMTSQFVVGEAAEYGQSGTILFDTCEFPVDWSDRCTLAAFNGGISAINCFGTNVGVPATGAHWAHDFDLHWDAAAAGLYTAWAGDGATLRSSGSPTDNHWKLKTAQLKLNTDYWPAFVEQTLKLPKNAIIKNIFLRKPANASGDATACTMKVGRDDKSGAPHLTSDNQQFQQAQFGDVTDYFYAVGATVNERTLRLYTTDATVGHGQGGFCLVEYY